VIDEPLVCRLSAGAKPVQGSHLLTQGDRVLADERHVPRREPPHLRLPVRGCLVVTLKALLIALGSRQHIALRVQGHIGDLAAAVLLAVEDAVHDGDPTVTVRAAWVAQHRHHLGK